MTARLADALEHARISTGGRTIDAAGGDRISWHDDGTGEAAYHKVSDVSALLEANRREQNEPRARSKLLGMTKVASIPLEVLDIAEQIHGVNPMRPEGKWLLKKILNDPDLRALRTNLGRV